MRVCCFRDGASSGSFFEMFKIYTLYFKKFGTILDVDNNTINYKCANNQFKICCILGWTKITRVGPRLVSVASPAGESCRLWRLLGMVLGYTTGVQHMDVRADMGGKAVGR